MQASNGGVAASPAATADADDASDRPAVAELPSDLTERILHSISPLESARHAVVCKSWASAVSARLARPVPHLFLSAPPHLSARRGLVVSVPLDGHQHPSPPPAVLPAAVRSADTNGMRCIGATRGGRVAFAAGWWSADVVLVDPVTGALDRVGVGDPCLDPRHSRVLAAGGGAGDAFFAVEGYELVLWRRRDGADAAWSRRAVAGTLDPTNSIVSAVDCNGSFYLLHEDGRLSRVVDDTGTAPPPLRVEKLPVESLAPDQVGLGHLLESDGEVLFVRQLLAYNKEELAIQSCTSTLLFEVRRLDVKEQRWTKVERLAGDQVLFVSPGSSFAVRASEVEGCRSNCIYFAGENQCDASPGCREVGVTSWGLYSMEERRVLSEHVVVTGPGARAEAVWFLPRELLCRRRSSKRDP